jgi:multidrug efflux system membrane fusion protein
MNAGPWCVSLSCSLLAVGALLAAEGPEPPELPVVQPIVRMVTDYVEVAGRTEAAASVELRARVTGFLVATPFKEGAEVKRGDVLFESDPRPYRAELTKAEAAVQLGEARLKQAELNYKRIEALFMRRAASKEELDRAAGERTEAQAGIRLAQANLEAAKLTLSFTRVIAPIDGRIGRRLVSPGNLVKADDTLLATIVSQAPIHVYFDVDERTALRLIRQARAGQLKGKGGLPVVMRLADEKNFPHRGVVNFADNRINPNTGTLRLRAVFDNPRPAAGPRLLMPGLSVRVRLMTSEAHKALLVPERAVVVDKGQAFLFVVNKKNVVEKRSVELGQRHDDLRVVEKGLLAEDRVALARGLRAGITVKPRTVKEPVEK